MDKTIYTEDFVSKLFDTMSISYQKMNTITSFGFYPRWRRQAIQKIKLQKGFHVTDFMTGIGECWKPILKQIGKEGVLTALDFSPGMLHVAAQRKAKWPEYNIRLLNESVFQNSIPDGSQDAVVCAYGLKTFTTEQIAAFTHEIHRILKPGGVYSIVDVSIPRNRLLKNLYCWYISKGIPFLSRLFSSTPSTYKMLGIYSKEFQSAQGILPLFDNAGLHAKFEAYFFGCATGVYGHKPLENNGF